MDRIYCVLEEYLKNKNIKDIKVEVRSNKDKENGDFYTNLSFKLSSILKQSPYEVGTSISEYIQSKIDIYYKVVVSENGYINFYATSDNYIYILKEIQKMDIKFDIKNINLINNIEQIIYVYTRLENIINILKLDEVYVDIEKFNISEADQQLKEMLDKTINIYDEIKDNKGKEVLIKKLEEICKFILKYEETTIIRYLAKEQLYNFIVITSCINILIKNILNNFKE